MSFPLQGQLITGPKLDEWLRQAIADARQHTWLCSAYIRSSAFLRLLSLRTSREPLQSSVLVRWQAQDLLSASSDLELFPICRERNVQLFMRLDFHGKVYAVPPAGISVGSTNATASGLGFGTQPNGEVNTLVDCTAENLRIVQDQFRGATLVTEQLYNLMRIELEGMQKSKGSSLQWSSEVLNRLQPPVIPKSLLVDECFMTDGRWLSLAPSAPRAASADHDLRLLGLVNSSFSEEELRSALRRTKFVRWLIHQVARASQRELYFGAITAALHDSLLDDPGPRRSEVKTILQNLLCWIQLADLNELSVDRPNYSQRVRLLYMEE
jgi:hypothetical protein